VLLEGLKEHGHKLGVVHALVAILVGGDEFGVARFHLLGNEAHLPGPDHPGEYRGAFHGQQLLYR
jgi:hypothetical protein